MRRAVMALSVTALLTGLCLVVKADPKVQAARYYHLTQASAVLNGSLKEELFLKALSLDPYNLSYWHGYERFLSSQVEMPDHQKKLRQVHVLIGQIEHKGLS